MNNTNALNTIEASIEAIPADHRDRVQPLRDRLVGLRIMEGGPYFAEAIVTMIDAVVVAHTPGQTYEEYCEGEPRTCECEMDFNCYLHRNRVGTWIETRYDFSDEPEWAL